jgi:hypothetical protein
MILISLIFFKSILMASNSCRISQSSNQLYLFVDNFDKFSDLNFTKCKKNYINASIIEFNPNNKLILDNSLNFTGLELLERKNTPFSSAIFTISFINLKGIDFKFNSYKNIVFLNKYDLKQIFWYIRNTNFDIYIKNQMINQKNCKSLFEFTNSFLNEITVLLLHEETKFENPICPIIFQNSKLRLLDIYKLSSGLITKNIISFYNLSTNIVTINSYIHQLVVNFYHYDLSERLLSQLVFKKLAILEVNGQINKIQDDLFKCFNELRIIRFKSQNVKSLFAHKNKWLNYLNPNGKFNAKKRNFDFLNTLILSIFQTFSNTTFYDYPDEDFCLFKDFPHNRSVLPKLKPIYKSRCTCTELYLIQYSYKYSKEINFYNDQSIDNYYILQPFYFNEINEEKFSKCSNPLTFDAIQHCNFKKRLDKCNFSSIKNKNENDDTVDWYVMDWKELIYFTYYPFSIFINPIFSFICILFTIITVCSLSDNKIKKESRKTYFFIRINSFSNLVFIFLVNFDLIVECFNINYFCSSLSGSKNSQYIVGFFLKPIKNTSKTFSHISYTSFILLRYLKISNTKNVYLKKFENLSEKIYVVFIFLFSFFINIYIIFEYSFKEKIPFLESSIRVIDTVDSFKDELTQSEYLILQIFQCLKLITSDIFFFIFTLGIDIKLIFFMRKTITQAISLAQGVITSSIKMKKCSKSRIVQMIILNGINFLILRLPLSLIDFYSLIYNVNRSKNQFYPSLNAYIICRTFLFCESLQRIFHFLYLISFIIQFFIFYKLDSIFKESVKNFLKIKN